MSSGFFGFFAHFGFLAALEESGIAPIRISGSSAGALAAAVWASGSPIVDLKKRLFCLTRADFWDPAPGPGLLKGSRFRNLLSTHLSVPRIEQCRIPLAVSAFDVFGLRTHTFREGLISEVVYASCCVPLLFQPIRIGKSVYLDGGIRDRAGLAGVPRTCRTLVHHLPSGRPGSRTAPQLSRLLAQRPDTVAVVINNVEPVGPRTLQNGRRVFQQSRKGLLRAFEKPVIDQQVVV